MRLVDELDEMVSEYEIAECDFTANVYSTGLYSIFDAKSQAAAKFRATSLTFKAVSQFPSTFQHTIDVIHKSMAPSPSR